jgi:protein-L-isoaspartate(D-aspartate) O-methyltransferase
MDIAAIDFAAARDVMVDGVLRPNKVTDPRLLSAARALPREQFLPADLRPLAYLDADVALGGERVLMQPLITIRLIQLAAPEAGEKALVIGAGTGYGAALLAACGASVTALEEDPALLAIARPALAAHAPTVRVVTGPLTVGYASGAPWDVILIEGAVASLPAAIGEQLKRETGRLVTVMQPPAPQAMAHVGHAVLAERSAAGLAMRPAFDAATTLLPGFAPAPAFVF